MNKQDAQPYAFIEAEASAGDHGSSAASPRRLAESDATNVANSIDLKPVSLQRSILTCQPKLHLRVHLAKGGLVFVGIHNSRRCQYA